MSNENKEFLDLLSSISKEQSFELELAPRSQSVVVICKPLTTSQLKELVKTVVDSPVTQSAFSSTVTKVFKDSLVETSPVSLNVLDRLLFILETRINSLSNTLTIRKENEEPITVNLIELRDKLRSALAANAQFLLPKTVTEGKFTLSLEVATLQVEQQLNEEIYKNLDPEVNNPEQLRTLLGDAFINEIAKVLKSITIEEKTLDLSKNTFKNRLKIIESLPASIIQKAIEYIENYKKIIDEVMQVNGQPIPIDGTLFSVR